MDRRLYWIWLQRAVPIGSVMINRLFEHFEDIEDVYAADKRRLKEIPLTLKIQKSLLQKSLAEAKGILKRMQDLGGWVLTPDDNRYPDMLRHTVGFPVALYGQGTFPDFNTTPSIAVVGTRHCSNDGAKHAFCLSAGLASAGIIVVSGGAVGGDTAAHEGALAAGGITVLVKGTTPEGNYPRENADLRRRILKSGGAIITEYPPGDKAICNYHLRNRLLSGMTLGVCVTEAPLRSGAMITANLAREQGRDVFAVPGNVLSGENAGAHHQIRQGATLVTCATDIAEEYAAQYPGMVDVKAATKMEQEMRRIAFAPPKQQQESPALVQESVVCETAEDASPDAQKLFSFMSETPIGIDILSKKSGFSVAESLVLLTELELLGYAECKAGQQYSKRPKGDR
jgi:DNA processing protein